MPLYLKQSTASQEVLLGVFVDDTDGKTVETGLTIANTDIKLWKSGATTLVNKNSGGATHISNGNYYAVLDATDTDTLGSMEIVVQVSGALPVRRACCVLSANVYDSLIGGGDNLEVDTTLISGDSTAADNAEAMFDGTGYAGGTIKLGVDAVAISGDTTAADNLELITELDRGVTINATGGTTGKDADDLVDDVWDEVVTAAEHNVATSAAKFLREGSESTGLTGTAQAGAAGSITLAAGEDSNDDYFNGERITIIEGTGQGQSRLITDYNGTTKVATVDRNWTTTPDSSSVYSILGAESDLRAVNGSTNAADNIEIVFATDFATNYSTANDKWQVEATVGGTVSSDVVSISGGSAAADNIEAAFDGTGGVTVSLANLTIGTAATINGNNIVDAGDLPTNFADLSITATTGRVDVASIEGSDATDQINAACDTAIETYGLDHLVSAAVVGADVTDNSIFAKLVSADASTNDWDDFDPTTDSLEAIGSRVANISSDTVLNVNGLISDGDVVILFQGEARTTAGGNAITLEVPAASTADYTGFTPKLGLTKLVSTSGTSSLEVTGTLNNAGTANQSFTFALTSAQTAALATSDAINKYAKSNADKGYAYVWHISATDGSTNCPTLAEGYFDVRARGTTC